MSATYDIRPEVEIYVLCARATSSSQQAITTVHSFPLYDDNIPFSTYRPMERQKVNRMWDYEFVLPHSKLPGMRSAPSCAYTICRPMTLAAERTGREFLILRLRLVASGFFPGNFVCTRDGSTAFVGGDHGRTAWACRIAINEYLHRG